MVAAWWFLLLLVDDPRDTVPPARAADRVVRVPLEADGGINLARLIHRLAAAVSVPVAGAPVPDGVSLGERLG